MSRIEFKKPGFTSVGMVLLIGFTALGLGWSELECLSAPKTALKVSVSDASEVQNYATSIGETDLEGVDTTPSEAEEELDRLALASQTHAINAREYFYNRKYWKAIGEAKKAIELNPQNLDAYDVRDRSYRKLGIRRKKREVMIQGVVCDVRTGNPFPAGMTRRERRELLSSETDITGMRITDAPIGR